MAAGYPRQINTYRQLLLSIIILSSTLRSLGGEEEGRVDMVIRPEGTPGIVVGSEDDTDEEEYYE